MADPECNLEALGGEAEEQSRAAPPLNPSQRPSATASTPWLDAEFTVLDAETEARVLALLPKPEAAGASRKRTRGACREFSAVGACRFGASCRFAHDSTAEVEAGRARLAMRALAAQRELLYTAGGATGAAVAGGMEGGAAGSAVVGGACGGSAAAGGASGGGAPAVDVSGDAGGVAGSSGAGNAGAADAAGAIDEDCAAADGAEGTRVDAMVGPSVTPLSMVARYYTRLYAPDAGGRGVGDRGWDVYCYLQANRVCVMGLAPAHPILRLHLRVTRVEFAPALRGVAPLTGKRKRGQVFVEANTILATAHTADGRAWPLRAGMRCGLLELNTALEGDPRLLERKPATRGHLAVGCIALKHVAAATAALLGEADYAQLCAARGLPAPALM